MSAIPNEAGGMDFDPPLPEGATWKIEPREHEMYGVFPGGDPRDFRPDEETNSPDQIQAWKDECAAWDRGEGVVRPPGCATMGDGSVWTGTGLGLGVTTRTWDTLVVTFADGTEDVYL